MLSISNLPLILRQKGKTVWRWSLRPYLHECSFVTLERGPSKNETKIAKILWRCYKRIKNYRNHNAEVKSDRFLLKRKRQFLRENFQLIKNVKIFGTKSFFRNYNSYPSISFLSFIISNSRIEIWQRKDFNFQIQTSSTFFPKLRLFLFWLAAIAKLSFVFLASMHLNKPNFS